MSNAQFSGLASARPERSVAELIAEHSASSERINAVHPYFDGQIYPRNPAREAAEFAANQQRIDAYHSRNYAFEVAEAANSFHWSDE